MFIPDVDALTGLSINGVAIPQAVIAESGLVDTNVQEIGFPGFGISIPLTDQIIQDYFLNGKSVQVVNPQATVPAGATNVSYGIDELPINGTVTNDYQFHLDAGLVSGQDYVLAIASDDSPVVPPKQVPFHIVGGASLFFQPPQLPDGAVDTPLAPFTVQAFNAQGQPDNGKTIVLALVDPNHTGAQLNGKFIATVSNGVASFSGLSISKGGKYELKALEIGTKISTISNEFNIANLTVNDAGDAVAADPKKGPSTDPNKNDVTLRSALQFVALHPDLNEIDFNIPGSAVPTIAPATPLPTVTIANLTIDGTTQPGGGLVEINGSGAGDNANGLVLAGGNDTIKGLVINRFTGHGIVLQTKGKDMVANNLIGTDPTGEIAEGNQLDGVLIDNCAGNTIGGNGVQVIAGNGQNGITIQSPGSTSNVVLDNNIGFDAHGTKALKNGAAGVKISAGASKNTIGSLLSVDRNVISGNGADGILVTGNGTTKNSLIGNFIGIDTNGTTAFGNAGDGVDFTSGAEGNTVGGTANGSRNIISGNQTSGVAISANGGAMNETIQGNFIGTDVNGTTALANTDDGVVIQGAAGNTIGGGGAAQGNVVSGNKIDGVDITAFSKNNFVQGNFIGTDVNGVGQVDNAIGVAISTGSVHNHIGGNSAQTGGKLSGEGNLISGNTTAGIVVEGLGTTDNFVQGNYIGTTATGAAALGNNNGIIVKQQASLTTIGGTTAAQRNIISGNRANDSNAGGDGILITGAQTVTVEGNFIGTDVTGATTMGTTGTSLGNTLYGVDLEQGAADNTIGGTGSLTGGKLASAGNLISGNRSGGILIAGAGTTGNTVEGNFIGTDRTGTAASDSKGNLFGNAAAPFNGAVAGGVIINGGAATNTIGGTAAGTGNLISGNQADGVLIADAGTSVNTVADNFIGTDVTGSAAKDANGKSFGNLQVGVDIEGAPKNTIGGANVGQARAGNVIADSGGDGLKIAGAAAADNHVEGNFVGTDVLGLFPLGNTSNGVEIADAPNNTIGGTGPKTGNLISGNSGDGVNLNGAGATGNVLESNFIGTDVTGTLIVGKHFETMGNNNGVVLAVGANNNFIGPQSGNSATDLTFNVITGNRLNGILIDGSTLGANNLITGANTARGNRIGTDVNGTSAPVNELAAFHGNGGDGISIVSSPNNTIGGLQSKHDGNLIAGNVGDGVSLTGQPTMHNTVAANFIGSDILGRTAIGKNLQGLGNGNGILIAGGASFNVIGGISSDDGNLISGNSQNGVFINNAGLTADTAIHGNAIQENLIGTQIDGTTALPRGNAAAGNGGIGILIQSILLPPVEVHLSPSVNTFCSNVIGAFPETVGVDSGNVVAFNAQGEIKVDGANGNSILSNRIADNRGNAALTLVNGANDSLSNNVNTPVTLNPPVLSGANLVKQPDGSSLGVVQLQFTGPPNRTFIFQIFASIGSGDGEVLLTTLQNNTDAKGNFGPFAFNFRFPLPTAFGNSSLGVLTATATDGGGNTTMFSVPAPLPNSGPVQPNSSGRLIDQTIRHDIGPGQTDQFTYRVIPPKNFGHPATGTVTFQTAAGRLLGTVQLAPVNGVAQAQVTASFPNVGKQTVFAFFQPDASSQGLTVNVSSLSVTVSQGQTKTTVSASPAAPTQNQAVTLSATVSVVAPAAGAPTGVVTFFDTINGIRVMLGNPVELAVDPNTGNDEATLTLPAGQLHAGKHQFTAVYGGDPNYLPSSSDPLPLSIV